MLALHVIYHIYKLLFPTVGQRPKGGLPPVFLSFPRGPHNVHAYTYTESLQCSVIECDLHLLFCFMVGKELWKTPPELLADGAKHSKWLQITFAQTTAAYADAHWERQWQQAWDRQAHCCVQARFNALKPKTTSLSCPLLPIGRVWLHPLINQILHCHTCIFIYPPNLAHSTNNKNHKVVCMKNHLPQHSHNMTITTITSCLHITESSLLSVEVKTILCPPLPPNHILFVTSSPLISTLTTCISPTTTHNQTRSKSCICQNACVTQTLKYSNPY